MFPVPVDPTEFRSRQPAVAVAVCFAVGIVLDRFVPQFTWGRWGLGAALAIGWAVWAARRSNLRLMALGLCGCWICLGGMRHHAFWSLNSVHDISQFLPRESQLIRLRGRVIEPPVIKEKSQIPFQSAFPQSDTTILTLECDSLRDGTRFVPVQGRVQVRVSGKRGDLRVADAIEVRGWASKPAPPANPGDFDFGDFLRRQGIECIVRVGEPEAVERMPPGKNKTWSRRVDDLRGRGERVLEIYLSDENARVANALLMGVRSTLPEDLRTAFAESGMMHVLALSGLHVGILAGLVWFICRLLHASPHISTLLMLAAVLGLVVISGGRPPIVRAAVLLTVAGLGRLADKQSHPHNILALAALVVLAWNPSNLFDVGTRLSFLAVMGIFMTAGWPLPQSGSDRLAPDESALENRLLRFTRRVMIFFWRYGCLMLGIWLLTAPLIASEFHLISPVGWVLNILLFPLITAVLWVGYITLFCGWLLPPLAGPLAILLNWGLSLMLGFVKWGADVGWGHLYVAGPPDWWLTGYYALLVGLYYFRFQILRLRFSGAVAVLSWTALGLAVALLPPRSPGLRFTFLSVGHGSAILVEFPNGRTLLYDAGALDDGSRAFRVVRTALWQRGLTHLDAVALSHPDLDHVNAIPLLAQEVPIGQVFVAKAFFKSPQAVVPHLVQELSRREIPLRAIGQDDRLPFDPAVRVEVKHPDPLAVYEHSNANSLVIRFTLGGRSVLLTGDVELEGLAELMENNAGQVDILQSPHHGSRTANTPMLADWANAGIVVVSGGRVPGRMDELRSTFGPSCRLFSTHDHGAVTVQITRAGQVLLDSTRTP